MHIFSSFFSKTVSFFPPISPSFVSFSLLSIFSPPLFAYSSPPPRHLTHPFPSVSLRHQGVFPPRQDAWQGSRWNGEQMTNLSLLPSLRLSLSLSLHLNQCPARGPPQPSFLPPSSTFPSYLTTLIFKSAQSAFHLLSPWRSRLTTKGERRWANVPTLILNPQLDIYKNIYIYINILWVVLQLSYAAHCPQICDEISWKRLIKDCETA